MTPTERKIEDLKAQIAALEAQADAEALASTTASWADGAYAITNGRGLVVVKARQIDANETSFVANTTPPLRVRAEMSKDHPAYEARVQTIADALLRCIQAEAGGNFEISKKPSRSQTAPSDLARKLRDWAGKYEHLSDAARVLGFPVRTFSGWVTDGRRPSMGYAARIAEVTGIPLDEVKAGCLSRTAPPTPIEAAATFRALVPKEGPVVRAVSEPEVDFHTEFVRWFDTAGRSQEKVARDIGVARNTIQNWLKGMRPLTPATDAIVKVTGIPRHVVLAGTKAPGRPRKD